MTETVESYFEKTGRRQPTRAEELRRDLEGMIVEGQLKPGDRLDETEIANRFKVSRTPVREAIKALVATGLAEVRGRQGTMVSTLSVPVLIEMFDLMAALEGLCARLAARRITHQEKTQMLAIQQQLIAAFEEGDPEAFYKINEDFHDLLYKAAHTHFLADQTIALRLRLSPYRRQVTFQPGKMRATLSEHQEIIDAIDAGDSDRAMVAASEHVRLLGDHLSDFIATIPPHLLG
ncbi:GntR family transcriptional regulator [Citreicella sp. C3M06]|uniref:GntR family transcriptional regulator n=1 Tax=Roseobacteraceae TaxID=2854170 RepID=UPI001C088288|nr:MULTISPECIES: GntR family transcriptional regulator [Roseobacteraceae]MBU2960260.1 GntR family transcriptional regulator [Citreicella sp. C3M06]MDO6588137.1 GntR family transcriptional regulator [Salipiger sp. 1_MG-2023]